MSDVPKKIDLDAPVDAPDKPNTQSQQSTKPPNPDGNNNITKKVDQIATGNKNQSTKPLIKPLDTNMKTPPKTLIKPILAAAVIVLAGVTSGFGISKAIGGTTQTKTSTNAQSPSGSQTGISQGDIIGSPDDDTYKDSAQGVLVKGGVGGEGSHHLLRPGGESQNVYLTSSVLDLDQLIDHEVQVWGETFAAQSAGWLMDVGRIKVINLNAQKPFEEAQ